MPSFLRYGIVNIKLYYFDVVERRNELLAELCYCTGQYLVKANITAARNPLNTVRTKCISGGLVVHLRLQKMTVRRLVYDLVSRFSLVTSIEANR